MQKVLFNPIDKNYKSEIGGGLKGVPQTFSVKVAKTEWPKIIQENNTKA